MTDYTPYQQKIIKRYYDNQDTIQRQRLAELVGELYLAEGKKRKKLWEGAAAAQRRPRFRFWVVRLWAARESGPEPLQGSAQGAERGIGAPEGSAQALRRCGRPACAKPGLCWRRAG